MRWWRLAYALVLPSIYFGGSLGYIVWSYENLPEHEPIAHPPVPEGGVQEREEQSDPGFDPWDEVFVENP